MRLVFWLVVAFLGVLGAPRSAQAFVRHTMDDQELVDVRAASPAAADDYVQAEARLRAGDLAEADKLLTTARTLQPTSFLIARRHCQVLTELGKRDEAIKACLVALSGMTGMDERAYVGALMSGKKLATPKDLADAAREAGNARHLVGQPFSDAAFCEIAHHIGDHAMFSMCLAGLEKNAPGYFETTRWRAARGVTPAWLYWVGWSVLVLLGALTLRRSFLRWFRAPAPRAGQPRTAAIALLAFGAALAAPARAQPPAPYTHPVHPQLSHFEINWDDPEANIPTIAQRNADALEFGYFLQDLAAEAAKAEAKSDYAYAVKFWRASAVAVPDAAVGFSRACRDYQLLNDRENALQFCSRALNLEGATTADYARFGELTVQKPGPLSVQEMTDLEAAIKHLLAQPNGAGPAAVLECQLGVKQELKPRLAHCVPVLSKISANDPHTLTYAWTLAMMQKNYGEAKRLLGVMAQSPMTPESLAELRAATQKAAAWWRRPFTDPRYGFGLLCLIGAGALTVIRKRAQLRAGTTQGGPAEVS